jgi:cysteine desulfurase/selenocysteine lyase
VTFTVAGHDAQEIAGTLRSQAINVSVSPADAARLDLDQRRLTSLVRASVHYYNTEAELDRLTGAIAAVR